MLIHAEQRDRTEVKMRMGTKTMEQLHLLDDGEPPTVVDEP